MIVFHFVTSITGSHFRNFLVLSSNQKFSKRSEVRPPLETAESSTVTVILDQKDGYEIIRNPFYNTTNCAFLGLVGQ